MESTKGRRFVVDKIFKEQGAVGSFNTSFKNLGYGGF
jgi:hypothetical protein